MRKPTLAFPTRSDIKRAVQPQKMAKCLKFWIWEVEELYCLCNENKDADQMCHYRTADLRVFAYATSRFSHDTAHLSSTPIIYLQTVLGLV